MRREPSIHIPRNILIKQINTWFEEQEIGKPAEELADYLLTNGKKYSIRHRSLLANTEQTKRRASRIQASPHADAMLLDTITAMVRRKNKHFQVTRVTSNDGAQWDFLLQAAGLTNDFCRIFNLTKKVGYARYVEIFLREIGKGFGYNRFKAFHNKILAHYECELEIEKDLNSEKTKFMYEIYQHKVLEKTGINLNYNDLPYEYVHFVRACKIAGEVGLTVEHYVSAQFEQLDFTNGYPTPTQLDTFKAKERAIRWAAENNIKGKKKELKLSKKEKDLWKSL